MNREEWLKSLKAGDLVADKRYRGYYMIFKINRITPKGSLRMNNGILLKENGEYHKCDWGHSIDMYIEPVTKEIKSDIAIRKETISLIKAIENINFRKLNIDKLRKIVKIIEE